MNRNTDSVTIALLYILHDVKLSYEAYTAPSTLKPSSTKMVTIVASYNVTPNQQTPKDPIWLSDSDQSAFLGHVPTIYIYKAKHPSNTIERLRNSLSKILVYYYPVAGRLSLTKSGRMEVDCNAKGVTLLEAETTNTFGDYGDFSPSEATEELIPKVDYTHQPIEEIPLLLVQLTRFHGGEGLSIGVAFSHPLVDAIAAIHFINAWAKLARGEELEPNEIPCHDRTILKDIVEQHKNNMPASAPRLDHAEWKPKPAPLVSDNIVEEKNKKTKVALLKLTSNQVERLKKKANDQPPKEGVRPYSRFEAIAAHTWRCASMARESGENQPTVARFSVDIRSRLNPPLPRYYFGNALARAVTPKCYVDDILSSSNPLSYAAQKIREAVYVITDEYIRSQLSVILGKEQLDCIRAFFLGQGCHMSSPHPGSHNLHITSWMTMPIYEADFGWGKPMYFGLGSEFREERVIIIPSSDGDGFIVSLSFQTANMQLFNKFFYDDI